MVFDYEKTKKEQQFRCNEWGKEQKGENKRYATIRVQ